tara:strand:+ start:109 stop:411 length:303 start_codon:yes stop_codon:yes gene_type:complete
MEKKKFKEENVKNQNVKENIKEKNVKPKKDKKNKCAFKGCKKRLKIINIECRCKNRYCSKHRLPENHNCKWDPRSNIEIEIYKKKAFLNVNAKFSKINKI